MEISTVRKILSRIIDVSTIDDDDTLFLTGINSLQISTFISTVKKECGIFLQFGDFFENSSIGALQRIIDERKLGGIELQ